MADLEIRLFGRFSVRSAAGIVAGLDSTKVQELFSFLLLTRRTHSREALADQLWGARAGVQARKALRQSLWQLQTALDNNLGCTGKIVLSDPDWVSLNPAADLWLDLEVFEHAARRVQGLTGATLTEVHAEAMRNAVELYGDGLMAGCYEEWCLSERERLQQTYLILLDKLMAYAEVMHDYETGLEYGERILRCDRARERTHRRMMRLYFLSGDRTGALHQYERCANALRIDLDVAPADSTRRLYEDLRLGRLETPSDACGQELLDSAGEASPSLLSRVVELGAGLAQIQQLQVHQQQLTDQLLQHQHQLVHLVEQRLRGH